MTKAALLLPDGMSNDVARAEYSAWPGLRPFGPATLLLTLCSLPSSSSQTKPAMSERRSGKQSGKQGNGEEPSLLQYANMEGHFSFVR